MKPDNLTCGAVLLAAGQGSRMGSLPKCLLTMNGVTLLERHLAAMAAAGIQRIVVVTGHYHERIEPVAASFPVTLVRNPDPDAGQPSSVKLGIRAMGMDAAGVNSAGVNFAGVNSPGVNAPGMSAADTSAPAMATTGGELDCVIVALADQPLVGSAELAELAAAFAHRPAGTDVVYPEVNGERGNPVVFSGALIRKLLATGRLGLRQYIDDHPQSVYRYLTTNEHFVIDLDTTDDVLALQRRTGVTLAFPGA